MKNQPFEKLFWRAALLAALVATPYAYYLKFPSVRESVDAKLPHFKQMNTGIVAWWDQTAEPMLSPKPTEKVVEQPETTAPPMPANEVATGTTPPAASVETNTPPQPTTVDLAELSRSRTEWPKTVLLKKAVEFPAVLNGNVIGSIKASSGTQVRLTVIRSDKIGVEFHGGSVMVAAEDTDLIARVAANPGRCQMILKKQLKSFDRINRIKGMGLTNNKPSTHLLCLNGFPSALPSIESLRRPPKFFIRGNPVNPVYPVQFLKRNY